MVLHIEHIRVLSVFWDLPQNTYAFYVPFGKNTYAIYICTGVQNTKNTKEHIQNTLCFFVFSGQGISKKNNLFNSQLFVQNTIWVNYALFGFKTVSLPTSCVPLFSARLQSICQFFFKTTSIAALNIMSMKYHQFYRSTHAHTQKKNIWKPKFANFPISQL